MLTYTTYYEWEDAFGWTGFDGRTDLIVSALPNLVATDKVVDFIDKLGFETEWAARKNGFIASIKDGSGEELIGEDVTPDDDPREYLPFGLVTALDAYFIDGSSHNEEWINQKKKELGNG